MGKDRRLRSLQRQLDFLGARLASLERLSYRYSWARLLAFAAGVTGAGLVYFLGDVRLFWVPLLLGFFLFLMLVHFHNQLDRGIDRHRAWMGIKRTHIARMQLDWSALPPCPYRPDRPLELDLDLLGDYSLFRLVNTAVTEEGADRLRDWLANCEPVPEETLRRQAIARELAPLSLFRDKLALNGAAGADDAETVDWPGHGGPSPGRLLSWLKGHRLSPGVAPWIVLLVVLAAINALLVLLDLLGVAPPLWRVTVGVYAIFFLLRSTSVSETFRQSAELRDELERLLAVFRQLECYSYRQSPKLKQLCQPFLEPEGRPSHHLKRVNRIVNATGIRGNPLFWLALNIVLPWDYLFAWRLERCRLDLVDRLPAWLDVWFELEALASLANLAYLNPAYSFPEFVAEGETGDDRPGLFEALELGHPLIPYEEKICNDLAVGSLGQINLITGSNMSGKSTFLRTVGINLALAYAGGPVDARELKTAVFRIHTCVRISDSVTDGVSYFYAEVKCLKSLLSELERDDPRPLFYLIDEIFRGTNNRERLIGSRAYIEALARKAGIGLIATHDLELVHLAETNPEVRNLHFSDDVRDGRMIFDYKLRPGPSPTTNALRIMRVEGLPV